jgi:hypothetical protein
MNPFKRFLQRLTSSQSKSSDNDNDGSRGWTIADQRATNNINEIRILSGHSDIVRGLVQLDERRYVPDKMKKSNRNSIFFSCPFVVLF